MTVYRPFKRHVIFKIICPRHGQQARHWQVAMHWMVVLSRPATTTTPCVLRSALFCYRLLLENLIRLYKKMPFWRTFGGKYHHKPLKYAWPYFHIVANKGLILDCNNYFQDNPICSYSYRLAFPKPLTRPFVLKYVKLLGFANQASLPPLQAPWGVTHEWTPFVLPSGLPVVM